MNIPPETPAIYAVRETIERLIAARPHDRAWIAAACAAGAPMAGDIVSEVAGDLVHRYTQCFHCLAPVYQCHHCACGISVGHDHQECGMCPACIKEEERLQSVRRLRAKIIYSRGDTSEDDRLHHRRRSGGAS